MGGKEGVVNSHEGGFDPFRRPGGAPHAPTERIAAGGVSVKRLGRFARNERLSHRVATFCPVRWVLAGRARHIVDPYRRGAWVDESFRDARSNLGLRGLWLATCERTERLLIVMAVVMMLAVLTALKWRSEHGRQYPQLSTKRRGVALRVLRQGLE